MTPENEETRCCEKKRKPERTQTLTQTVVMISVEKREFIFLKPIIDEYKGTRTNGRRDCCSREPITDLDRQLMFLTFRDVNESNRRNGNTGKNVPTLASFVYFL